MSPREQTQEQLLKIFKDKGMDTNPMGNHTTLAKIGKGKIRVVHFGLARYLDAKALIYSPDRIEILASGPLADRYWGTYHSVKEIEELVFN